VHMYLSVVLNIRQLHLRVVFIFLFSPLSYFSLFEQFAKYPQHVYNTTRSTVFKGPYRGRLDTDDRRYSTDSKSKQHGIEWRMRRMWRGRQA
jgi:hypothetical protein